MIFFTIGCALICGCSIGFLVCHFSHRRMRREDRKRLVDLFGAYRQVYFCARGFAETLVDVENTLDVANSFPCRYCGGDTYSGVGVPEGINHRPGCIVATVRRALAEWKAWKQNA